MLFALAACAAPSSSSTEGAPGAESAPVEPASNPGAPACIDDRLEPADGSDRVVSLEVGGYADLVLCAGTWTRTGSKSPRAPG